MKENEAHPTKILSNEAQESLTLNICKRVSKTPTWRILMNNELQKNPFSIRREWKYITNEQREQYCTFQIDYPTEKLGEVNSYHLKETQLPVAYLQPSSEFILIYMSGLQGLQGSQQML